VRKLSAEDRVALLSSYVGIARTAGTARRAFERTDYRFEIVSDYGAFRDLSATGC